MSSALDVSESHLALEVPAADRYRAIAEEGSLGDGDLDQLERRLLHDHLPPEEQAPLALALGRAGRAQSGWALAEARTRLLGAERKIEGLVVALALDLLAVPPNPRVERAEAGYRYRDATGGQLLYVDDPIAAHWHALGGWGPPIRPDPSRSARALRGSIDVAREFGLLATGEVAVVTFSPGRFASPEPALRLVLAGMARDPRLAIAARWSQVRSVGSVMRRGVRALALEVRAEPLLLLPLAPSIPSEELIALFDRLIAHARR